MYFAGIFPQLPRMDKKMTKTLVDIGDLAFQAIMSYLYRNKTDSQTEVTLNSNDLQETIFLHFADNTDLVIKIFPHKNFLDKAVFRFEVFRTRPGDPRGNRIAFVEIPKGEDTQGEIRLFIEGILGQCEV